MTKQKQAMAEPVNYVLEAALWMEGQSPWQDIGTSPLYRAAEKAPACEHVCQQAVDYGVWPEHSCYPACVYLTKPANKPPGQL